MHGGGHIGLWLCVHVCVRTWKYVWTGEGMYVALYTVSVLCVYGLHYTNITIQEQSLYAHART